MLLLSCHVDELLRFASRYFLPFFPSDLVLMIVVEPHWCLTRAQLGFIQYAGLHGFRREGLSWATSVYADQEFTLPEISSLLRQ